MISIAIVDTRAFQFIGSGHTPEQARAAVMAAWAIHARETGADLDYITEDAVSVYTGPVGQAWRDYEPMLQV